MTRWDIGYLVLRIVRDKDGKSESVGVVLWCRQILGSSVLCAYVLPMIVLYLTVPLFGFNLVGALIAYWELWGLFDSSVLVPANHVCMGFDAEGRGWHDVVVGTVVVDRQAQSWASGR